MLAWTKDTSYDKDNISVEKNRGVTFVSLTAPVIVYCHALVYSNKYMGKRTVRLIFIKHYFCSNPVVWWPPWAFSHTYP